MSDLYQEVNGDLERNAQNQSWHLLQAPATSTPENNLKRKRPSEINLYETSTESFAEERSVSKLQI